MKYLILITTLPLFFLIYIFPFFLQADIVHLLMKLTSIVFFIFSLLLFFHLKRTSQFKNKSIRYEKIFLILFLALHSFLYLYTLNSHLKSFFLVDFDYLALAEILNNAIQGKFFVTHHYGKEVSGNYLSHHFSPALLLLSPFLLLSETRLGYGYGLLAFELGIYLIIAFLLIKKRIRGDLFFLCFLLFANNLQLNRLFFSYHFEILTLFFFLLFFVGREMKSKVVYVLAFLFLVLLKEDISIYTSFLGIYFIFRKEYRIGSLILIISLFYFFFVPSFFRSKIDSSASVNWLEDWSYWGKSYYEIIVSLVSRPFEVISILFAKWKVIKDFLISFSPIILFDVSIIVISLPIFILHFISSRIWYNTLYNYYSYTVISFWVLGFILSMEKIRKTKWKRYLLPILLFSISISLYRNSNDKLFPTSLYTLDSVRLNAIEEIIEIIPPNQTVSSQFDLGGFVKRVNPIFPLHEKNLDKDYLLVDREKGITPYVDRERINQMLLTVENSYTMLKKIDGIELYKKNSP